MFSLNEIIQYDNAERHRVYAEKDGNINMTTDIVYEGISPKPVRGSHLEVPEGVTPFASYTVIPNVGYSNSLLERIINSILTSIKTVKIDGKEFYEVSGKYSPSTLYSENTEKISVYVEKETGLTIKKVEIIDENGQEKADKYAARPGFSEHELGLALDLANIWTITTKGE